MDPQLLMQSPAMDFHFESTSTSAYASAPSSPKVILPNFFFSAPTSPTSSLYDVSPINPDAADDFRSIEPFANRDQIQGHGNEDYEEEDKDFAFDFSGQLERPSISDVEDLFHGGKIKPLDSPKSPMFSPRAYSKRYFEASSDDQTKNPCPRLSHILVNYMGQEADKCPLSGGVSLCNPFDLVLADEDFQTGFNNVYDKSLASSIQKKSSNRKRVYRNKKRVYSISITSANSFRRHALLFEELEGEYNIPAVANCRSIRE